MTLTLLAELDMLRLVGPPATMTLEISASPLVYQLRIGTVETSYSIFSIPGQPVGTVPIAISANSKREPPAADAYISFRRYVIDVMPLYQFE